MGRPVTSIETVGTEYRVNRNYVRQGDTVRIDGERGSFTFQRVERNTAGAEWGVFVGGKRGHVLTRYFTMDRVIRTRDTAERRGR